MSALFLLLLLIPLSAFAVPVVPAVPGGVEPGATLRAFMNHGDFSGMAELEETSQTDDRQYKQATVGAYYRVVENLKIGAFYQRAYGLRHDEDWVDANGRWSWVDSDSRGENLLIGDVTPVSSLDFLGKNWVGEFKVRYVWDTFNGQATWVLRPGLRYFWLRDEQPFMSFFFQVQANLPINYGVGDINEEWVYSGALYRVATRLDLGAFAAAKWQTWGSTGSFLSRGGTPYSVTAQTWELSALGIFQFDL